MKRALQSAAKKFKLSLEEADRPFREGKLVEGMIGGYSLKEMLDRLEQEVASQPEYVKVIWRRNALLLRHLKGEKIPKPEILLTDFSTHDLIEELKRRGKNGY